MKLPSRALIVVALVAAACNRTPPAKEYHLTGQIVAVKPAGGDVMIKGDDIPGFMPAMTMPYRVGDPKLLADKQPGDLITATLVVGETEAHLSAITKTGHAAVVDAKEPEITASEMLNAGDPMPDTKLVDESGMARPLASLKGHRVALTFIYTRCPQPDFCPLMDRNFAALQGEIKKTAALRDVRLVSVTFDPAYDTPAVLKTHATTLQADPAIWHFVTAGVEDTKAFAAKFGVSAMPSDESPNVIVHNLSTAVIGTDGKLVKLRTGNMWTPADLIGDLELATPPPH